MQRWDTGLYYLQSRYYDPEIGRFLNADVYVSTGQGFVGNNMFAYCLNNPVILDDLSGRLATLSGIANPNVMAADSTTSPYWTPPTWRPDGTGKGKNWNLFNSDVDTVLESNTLSFYKGQLVIREDWEFTNNRSGSFGVMFLNSNETSSDTVNHEWGHFAQLKLMGVPNYALSVTIPSICSDPYDPNYYSNPWERTADLLGGVVRVSGYTENSLAWGISQFIVGPISVLAYYLFGA